MLLGMLLVAKPLLSRRAVLLPRRWRLHWAGRLGAPLVNRGSLGRLWARMRRG